MSGGTLEGKNPISLDLYFIFSLSLGAADRLQAGCRYNILSNTIGAEVINKILRSHLKLKDGMGLQPTRTLCCLGKLITVKFSPLRLLIILIYPPSLNNVMTHCILRRFTTLFLLREQ